MQMKDTWTFQPSDHLFDTRYDKFYKVVHIKRNSKIFGNCYVVKNLFNLQLEEYPKLFCERWCKSISMVIK